MPTYMYQCAYTPESLAAQLEDPTDRMQTAARPAIEAVGGRFLAGGFRFGDFDAVAIYEAPDDVSAAAFSVAIGAAGAIKAAKTTRLLSGDEWVQALHQARLVTQIYRPARLTPHS